MTDVLSRMLNDPNSRGGQPPAQETESSQQRSESASESASERDAGGGEAGEANPSGSALTDEQASTSAASLTSQAGGSSANLSRVLDLSEASASQCVPDSSSLPKEKLPGTDGGEPSSSKVSNSAEAPMEADHSEVEKREHSDEDRSYNVIDPSIEGLQDRISSLRQGFVEK